MIKQMTISIQVEYTKLELISNFDFNFRMSSLEGNANAYLWSEAKASGCGMSYGAGPTAASNIAFWTGPGHSLCPGVGPGVWPCFEPSNSIGPNLFELAEHTRFEQQLHYDWNRPGDAPRPNARSGSGQTEGPGVTNASQSIGSPDSFNDDGFGFGSDNFRQPLGHVRVATSSRRSFMQNSTIGLDDGQYANRRFSLFGELQGFHEDRNRPTHDLYGISFGIIFKSVLEKKLGIWFEYLLTDKYCNVDCTLTKSIILTLCTTLYKLKFPT